MRERALRGGLGLAVTLVVAVAATAGSAATLRLSLKPGTGGVHTGFVLRFRNPVQTGTVAGLRRTDRVMVAGPRGSGCTSRVSYALRPARAGAMVRTVIRSGRRRWCSGRYRGQVIADIVSSCRPGPARACPLFMLAPRTIARFGFRVRAAAGGGGTGATGGTGGTGGTGATGGSQAPTFAGLQSATFCASSPVHGTPTGRTYTLRWNPASDPVTPAAQLVYDIYFSANPGGEDFASPTWTSQPGASAYSGTLSTSGSAYFVVRARDAAGHEDANTVERLAVSSC
ncbi:MAG TPA: hypothetical protein VFN55_02830 [Solirubrobacteraceae bacterium]|nr:hypothetical protein [Solirubrobacteraceae bacterium]